MQLEPRIRSKRDVVVAAGAPLRIFYRDLDPIEQSLSQSRKLYRFKFPQPFKSIDLAGFGLEQGPNSSGFHLFENLFGVFKSVHAFQHSNP